jgi:SAM-dependent methyltransferase
VVSYIPWVNESRELTNRFGESSVTKMRKWATEHLPPSKVPIRVLECGSGNGTLLLSFLTSPESAGPQPFHLTGIDYSEGSTRLSRSIEANRRDTLEADAEENDEVVNPVEVDWRTGDLLADDMEEQWDLVLDKGTFDALCLSQEVVAERGNRLPSVVYPEQVAKLVNTGGFFLITSCNFTEEEIKRRWTKEGLGFQYQ